MISFRISLQSLLSTLLAASFCLANPAAKSPVEDFAVARAKFATEQTRIMDGAKQMIKSAGQPYVAALSAAADKATKVGDLEIAKILNEEKELVLKGDVLDQAPTEDFPKALLKARTKLLQDVEKVVKDQSQKTKSLVVAYSKALDSLEARAKAAGNAELVGAVAAERAGLTAVVEAASKAPAELGKNAVVNGDFSQHENGQPKGWSGHNGVVVTEGSETFLRAANADGRKHQIIKIPAGAKTMKVSGRMRSTNFLAAPDDKFQSMDIGVLAKHAGGRTAYLVNLMVRGGSKRWTKLERQVELKPDVTEVEVLLGRWGVESATIDYDDIEITFK